MLNQFADDMDIFSLCKKKSITAIYEELDRFKYQSGFTVSYEKTTLYRIGSLRHSDAEMYNLSQFAWSNKDITVLGVTIAHEDIVSKNYVDIIPKVKSILNAWNNRGLSLMGKVQVVNTLVASLFVYRMMVLPSIPKNIVKNVENIIRDYIWGGRKSKISFKILQNPKQEGGLNLVNLVNKDTALKATWPQILSCEWEYAQVVYSIMRCTSISSDIWRCSLRPKDVGKLKITSEFWRDVLKAWAKYNAYYYIRIENQYIWYNSRIQIGSKPIFWRNIYEKGLKYVYQLFEGKRFKKSQDIKREFGLSELRYNSLKSAIPIDWKEYFCQHKAGEYLPIPHHNYDYCIHLKGKGLSQKVYRYI